MSETSGYGQYCPIARAVEVLGERWSVLIVRDLLCGFNRFNDLARCLPGLSRHLAVEAAAPARGGRHRRPRRRPLRAHAGGRGPAGCVFGLGEWSAKWQFGDPRESELDPELLMWWVHRRLDFSQLPDQRLVFEFRFHDERKRFWIMRETQGPSVCLYDPGFGIDATIESDLRTMYQVWLGKVALRAAMQDGRVVLNGKPSVVRRLPDALELSPIADRVSALSS